MLQVVLWAVLAIAVAGGMCALAVVFLPAGEQIAPPLRDEPVWALPPERGLSAHDVDTVRLPVALRGYRFAETDQLLDRLAEEIRSRDVELARLRGDGATYSYPSTPAATIDEPSTDEPLADELPVDELPLADELPVDEPSDEPIADPPVDHRAFAPPEPRGADGDHDRG